MIKVWLFKKYLLGQKSGQESIAIKFLLLPLLMIKGRS